MGNNNLNLCHTIPKNYTIKPSELKHVYKTKFRLVIEVKEKTKRKMHLDIKDLTRIDESNKLSRLSTKDFQKDNNLKHLQETLNNQDTTSKIIREIIYTYDIFLEENMRKEFQEYPTLAKIVARDKVLEEYKFLISNDENKENILRELNNHIINS